MISGEDAMKDPNALWDIRAIEQVYFRYCEVIDAKDFDRLSDVFTEDAVGDYRSSNGILQQGLAPLVERLHRGMGKDSDCGATQHNVFNIRIDLEGDGATSKAHFYAVHAGLGRFAGQIYSCWGQYDDRWVRTPAGWRVRERLYANFLTDGPVEIIRATGRTA
jgi:3-phenylpropionate/cinnamic acid dioxygenase small subunit